MLGCYNYTVLLTYFGMLVSFTGITAAWEGRTKAALLCLMLSGICDMFDGWIASTKTRTAAEKRFGVQIDSLSDLICFGVFPALLVYQTSRRHGGSFYISALYLLCALIRLAHFNVDEEERRAQTQERRREYLGLPVTMAALFLPAAFGLSRILRWPTEQVGPVVLLLMGAAFLMPFRLKKPALPGKVSMLVIGIVNLLILCSGADL